MSIFLRKVKKVLHELKSKFEVLLSIGTITYSTIIDQ